MTYDPAQEFMDWMDRQPPQVFKEAMAAAHERDTEWWDEDSFVAVVTEVLQRRWVDEVLTGLVLKGVLEPALAENGQLGYALTDKGRGALDKRP